MTFIIAGESELDLSVGEKIVAHFGHGVFGAYSKGGHVRLDGNLRGYANASRQTPWLILRDLDHANCAAALADQLLPERAQFPDLFFRIVVREIEAWLLADRPAISQYLGVSQAIVPGQPEQIAHPKEELIRVASRSRHRQLREGIVPRAGSGATIGPEYNALLHRFVVDHWDVSRAAESSESLRRLLDRLAHWTEQRN
jgi:hypothetical protein